MFEESEREEREAAMESELRKKSVFGLSSKEDVGGDEDSEEESEQASPVKQAEPGCPMFMQTAPGIKMLTQVPRAVVGIDLASLMRFILAHFADLHELKLYLESCKGDRFCNFCFEISLLVFGGEFFVEQLEMVEKILGKLVKYLLLPGVSMDININGKVSVLRDTVV